ncbi:ATP-dependent 6-phosphofructokinase [Clostridium botulinum]|uniref:ATP-dependent 6-phosphofructokinase n=3 Tax=Clostridium botulinum TaxID=1491 RepID=PFKA_CLOB6|nr:6-phosphofructokinase [Clostridium botulinum]B1L266.1 RecName: Full=ATP-dependent 6-phosphofructokinase; Short=ATP-PFK; Short=Phosphofructokinase; AltName: Full=Phosphohexokinase [Clostridium botulinum A3 str. Loch Maree]C3KV06.1 RecName: Full=ATP-dependent 6-phosphofructokinase; Short=ATP-PFK; Short=Phosphofructokinase; AltName: Full=Phosphohexokinase [Clostridium botulinum Ba4 str. 657]AJD27786.1 6-phosphofructokinase [Clostridium botulinum CDC_297]EPS46744.1 6-phosphofructokinase [Clostri
MRTIAVLTSGGDAPGMNAAIRAVVRTGLEKGLKVMGIQRGYNGLINGEIFEMDTHSVSDIIQRGGTILRTARCEEFRTEQGREKAAKILKAFGIDGLVVIGGDGSFHGAQLLSKLGINTVGLPGTIDNDLAYTDYTIGFDTSINTVLDAINKLRDTSTSHERVSVVEVMGRNCGDIALYTGVAGGAESIIIPEKEYNADKLCKQILQGKLKGKMHNLVLLAEGVGGANELAKYIEEVTGIETRSTILGHIQRGGSPTCMDRILASRMAYKAVELLISGKSSRVVGIKNGEIIDMDIDEALAVERSFDQELYDIATILSK